MILQFCHVRSEYGIARTNLCSRCECVEIHCNLSSDLWEFALPAIYELPMCIVMVVS
jgi:hypothetical protein